jgi:hypothetical protein
MASVLMQTAGYPGIRKGSREPLFDDLLHVASATPKDVYSATVQDVDGPLTHVSGQHHLDTHLCQGLGNVRFAPAIGRRGNRFLRQDFMLVIDGEYREVFTMAEMFIYLILS